MILSEASSAVTSSEFGRIATPWIDSSSENSTKSCRLMKPRIGGGAVITMIVSPASGSTSRCTRPGLDNGTVTLASAGSVMLRIATSGCAGVRIVSANVSVQFVPLAWSSPVSEGICGRLRRMRIACPLSSGNRLTSAMIEPPLLRIGSTSIASVESNTSHTVSARRNNAAGVAASKENVRCRPSLFRFASTLAALSPALSPALASTGGSDAARVIFCGISAARRRHLLYGRHFPGWRRLLGWSHFLCHLLC